MCASAIVHRSPWIIEDAAVDVLALSNPLRAGGFGLRCDAQEIKTLDNLPTLAMNDLDLRHKNRLRTQKDPDEPCGLPVNSDVDGGAAGPTPNSVDRKVAGWIHVAKPHPPTTPQSRAGQAPRTSPRRRASILNSRSAPPRDQWQWSPG